MKLDQKDKNKIEALVLKEMLRYSMLHDRYFNIIRWWLLSFLVCHIATVIAFVVVFNRLKGE